MELMFSNARLAKLRTIYGLSFNNAILLHEQLNELNGSVFSSLALFEVHLRNVIIAQLEVMFGSNWQSQSVFTQAGGLKSGLGIALYAAQKNQYSKLPHQQRLQIKSQFSGTSTKIKKQAIQSMQVSTGDIVSHTYFSFWKAMFSNRYEPTIWRAGLRKIFPKKTLTRGDVSNALEIIHKVRNRVAHHEFIHPNLCREYLNAVDFITKEIRISGKVRKGKVFRFQQAYIEKIELQLVALSHFLDVCQSR